MTDVVFLDTETTGLGLRDEIWEFAAIRRGEDGTETTTHIHIEFDFSKIVTLPEKFQADIKARFGVNRHVYSPAAAAAIIYATLEGKPHLVGANIAFDAGMIERLLDAHGFETPWHYHLVDVETLSVGALYAQGTKVHLPWRSDDLAFEIGVPVTGARHTALGDALWVRDWYDVVAEGQR